MERYSLLRIAVMLLILAAWPGGAARAVCLGEDYLRGQLLHNAVVIRVGTPESAPEFGLGFIVGRQGETLWIATAAHVVFAQGSAGLEPRSAVSIWLKGFPQPWSVTTEPRPATNVDLAFLSVRIPVREVGIDRWREAVIADDPVPGERVWIVGRPSELDFDDGTARIGPAMSAQNLGLEGVGGQPGQSGAMVVTTRGVVGMRVASMGNAVVPIEAIRRSATQAGIPWALVSSQLPPPVDVRVCLETTGPYRPRLELGGLCGVVPTDANGCATVIAGRQQVVPAEQYLSCTPSEFIAGRQAERRVRVSCEVDPAGLWRSAELGFLQVTRETEQVWSIRGLDVPLHGQVTGRLTGQPPLLSVDANTASGVRVLGNLDLAPRRLDGRLMFDGIPINVNLAR